MCKDFLKDRRGKEENLGKMPTSYLQMKSFPQISLFFFIFPSFCIIFISHNYMCNFIPLANTEMNKLFRMQKSTHPLLGLFAPVRAFFRALS